MNRRKTVLLLDFDAELLIALEHLLENCGFDCTSTWDVDQAFALVESRAFDILVVGNRPPELNPHAILSELRQRGFRFGSFILGSVDRRDGFSNLLDQLRSFPCELPAKKIGPIGRQELREPSEQVCHGS